jgi:3-methyladenine DNA glycosylase AlkD
VDALLASLRQELSGLARTEEIRSARRALAKKLRGEPPATALRVAQGLLEDSSFAHQVVAYELLASSGAYFELLTPGMVERWSRGLADWGSVDLFGVTIAGRAWREGIVTDAAVQRWARSRDRWLRRLSLVATVPLNSKARGGSGDAARTTALCAMHLDDRDPMVVKALSWALRELAKRDPTSARQFLERYDKRLAALPRREVRNVLKGGTKSGRPRAR